MCSSELTDKYGFMEVNKACTLLGEFLVLVKHKYMHVVSLCRPSKSCFSCYIYNEKYTMFLILHGHVFLMKVFKKFLVFMCNDIVYLEYVCTYKTFNDIFKLSINLEVLHIPCICNSVCIIHKQNTPIRFRQPIILYHTFSSMFLL